MNRIKVVSEPADLVETKWQTSATMQPEKAYHAFYSSFHINATAPVHEISDVLYVAMMTDRDYVKIEKVIHDMVGEEGRFAGEIADTLKVSQTMLKSLVKRSTRLDFRGHRILRFEE